MRRIILLITAAVIAVAAAAQSHYKAHVWVGGRGGVTLARQDLSPSVPQSWLMGSTGAVTFRYAEEKLFGLVAELGWTQRGWKENFEESPLSYSRTLTYINLPVMTQIIFGGRRAKCFINLGPQIAFMIGENISADFDYKNIGGVSGWPDRPRQTAQLDMAVSNKFDYGIAGGIGGEFYVQPRHSITLEVRYYFGLGNIFPSSKADHFSASRCTSIEATVGYNFRLK